MKKVLLCLALVFSAVETFAAAKWVLVVRDLDNTEYFVDANSMQQSGDTRTYWQKTNYPERSEYGDLSSKAQRTVNCRTRESIYRFIIFYDDRDNMGKITSSGDAKDSWEPIPPDSFSEAVYKYVCKK